MRALCPLPLFLLAYHPLLTIPASASPAPTPADLLLAREAQRATPDASGDPSYTPPSARNVSLSYLPDARPEKSKRRFISSLVDAEIERVADLIADPALKRIWKNAYPNTLDTTVAWTDLQIESQPDHEKAFPRTFIITGDILSSWVRDGTSQVNPYLELLANPPAGYTVGDKGWTKLYRLVLGLIYQQSEFVITDPLANSFGPPNSATITHNENQVMEESSGGADWIFPPPPGQKGFYIPYPNATQRKITGNDDVYLWESKWEVDSLANFLRLPVNLHNATGRRDFVNNKVWQRAVRLAVDTLRAQQRSSMEEHDANMTNETAFPPGLVSRDDEWTNRFGGLGGGVYRFQRLARSPTETRSLDGFGEPANRTGLVKSAFRPSDDATVFPFLIPSNAQLAVALEGLGTLLEGIEKMQDVRSNVIAFAKEIRDAITEWATVPRKAVTGVFDAGDVFAYEVDGYGSQYFMDDANVPSLLSLPYLGYVSEDDEIYQRTRKLVLSAQTNKFFFQGKEGEGIGGPHVGWNYAWPMSLIMCILTTDDTDEIVHSLEILRSTTAGTGLIHESFNVNNATDFTRPWFAWVNGLFGEAILKVARSQPDILKREFS